MFREYGPPDDFRSTHADTAGRPLAPESKRRSRAPLDNSEPARGPLSEHEEHEALADLFLGELGQVAARDAALGLTPWASRPAAAEKGVRGITASLHSSRSPELEPTLRTVRRVDSIVDNSEHPAPAANAPLIFEALVLGHLPVMGSAWANQYARSLAGPGRHNEKDIAVVRFHDGQARFELSSRSQHAVEDVPGHVARCASHVVVFGDSHNEQALLASEHVGRITLLCGADEAGIVDAYRTLKALSDTRDWSTGRCHLGVAIMGASGARAATAFARLRDSADRFLSIKLVQAGQFGRIEGGPAMHALGSIAFGGTPGGANAVLSAVANAPRTTSGPARPASAASGVDEAADFPLSPIAAAETVDAAPLAPHDAGVPATNEATFMHHGSAALITPASDASSPNVGSEGRRRGLSLIAAHFPHLTPLAARCPFADDIELAVDADGALHVLAAAMNADGADAAVRALTAVIGWAKANRTVLALTLPAGCGLDCGKLPRGHFLTTCPAAHRTLLDSSLSIHVLAPVVRAVSSDWVVVPLN